MALTNILVDNASRIVLMAGKDYTNATAQSGYTDWIENYRPTAPFTVYENVTLVNGYLDECWTYSDTMVWAIVPGKETEVNIEIFGDAPTPANVTYTTSAYDTNSGVSTRMDMLVSWESSINGDVRYQLQYRTVTTVLPEIAGGDVTYTYGNWSAVKETHALGITVGEEASINVEDIATGDYQVRVRGIDDTTAISPWVIITAYVPPVDVTVPNVTGLELFGQGDNPIFLGPDMSLRWFKVGARTIPDAYGPAGATQPNVWFRYYELKIYNSDDTIRRVEYLTGEEYLYTFDKNYTDGRGQPERHLRVELRAVATWGGLSPIPAIISVENTSPAAVTGFRAISFFNSFEISWDISPEMDVLGYAAHVSRNMSFVADESNMVYNGTANGTQVINIPGEVTDYVPSGLWYIKVAAYDVFGPYDLNYGAVKSVQVASLDSLDTVAPNNPATFTIESAVDNVAATPSSNIRLLWAAAVDTDGDFATYLVRYRKDGDTIYHESRVEGVASTTLLLQGFIPGVTYWFSMCTLDKWSNQSAWMTEQSIVAATITTTPNVPTFAVGAGLKRVIISVAPSTAADHGGYEVYVDTSTGFTPDISTFANRVAKEPSTLFGYDGLANTTYYVRVRAYNTSGIFSAFAAEQSVLTSVVGPTDVITTGELITLSAQIKDAIISSAKIISLAADKITTGTMSATSYIDIGTGNAKTRLDGVNNKIVVTDETGQERVVIGKQTGSNYYGMSIKNAAGADVFKCYKDANGTDQVVLQNLTAGTINANLVTVSNLVVGTNVAMGTGAVISWSNIIDPQTGGLTADQTTKLTYISSTGIYTGTMECNRLTTNNAAIQTLQLAGSCVTVPIHMKMPGWVQVSGADALDQWNWGSTAGIAMSGTSATSKSGIMVSAYIRLAAGASAVEVNLVLRVNTSSTPTVAGTDYAYYNMSNITLAAGQTQFVPISIFHPVTSDNTYYVHTNIQRTTAVDLGFNGSVTAMGARR